MKRYLQLLILVLLFLAGCSADASWSEQGLLRQMDGAAVNQITLAAMPIPVDSALPQFTSVQLQQAQRQWIADDGTVAFTHQTDNVVVAIPENVASERLINTQLTEDHDQQTKNAEEMAAVALEEYRGQEESELWDFYGYSSYTMADIARLDGVVFSLVTYHSTYTGGAHPNNWQSAWNFDVTTGVQLSLADILTEQGADLLREIMLLWLNQRAQEFGFLADYQEVAQERLSDNLAGSQNNFWYFSKDGLVLFFSPYDISPYAAGVIKAEFPYAQLEKIVKPAYLPCVLPESSGTAEIFLMNDEENMQLNSAAICMPGDGMELGIRVHGILQNVSITQIPASNLHAVEGNVQYAANYLYNGCILRVVCRLSDDTGIRLAYETDGEQSYIDIFYGNTKLILQGGHEF